MALHQFGTTSAPNPARIAAPLRGADAEYGGAKIQARVVNRPANQQRNLRLAPEKRLGKHREIAHNKAESQNPT